MDRVRPRLGKRAQGFYSLSYHWFLRLSCQVLSTLGSRACLWEAEEPWKPFSMGVHTRHLCFYKLLAVGQLTPLGSVSSTSLLRGKNKKQTISLLFINISRTPSRSGGEESKEEDRGTQLSVEFFIPTWGRAGRGPCQALWTWEPATPRETNIL